MLYRLALLINLSTANFICIFINCITCSAHYYFPLAFVTEWFLHCKLGFKLYCRWGVCVLVLLGSIVRCWSVWETHHPVSVSSADLATAAAKFQVFPVRLRRMRSAVHDTTSSQSESAIRFCRFSDSSLCCCFEKNVVMLPSCVDYCSTSRRDVTRSLNAIFCGFNKNTVKLLPL